MKQIMLIMMMTMAALLAGCASTRPSKKCEFHKHEVTTETETQVVVD